MSAGPQDRTGTRCFYLIDEQRSADLASYREALKALAQLSCQNDGENSDAIIDRGNLRCLWEQLEKRLADILCDGHLQSEWLDRPIQSGPETFQ